MSGRGPLVLLYHRVEDLDVDPQGLAVAPTSFTEQLAVLKERTSVVPLAEAQAGHAVITFDDGYEDNLLHAVPALANAGLPATFFICSGGIGNDTEMWWDRLEAVTHRADLSVDFLDLDVHGVRMWSDVRDLEGRRRTYWSLFWRLRPLPVDVITAVLDEVEALLGVNAPPRPSHRMMTGEQLCELERAGFEVGAHTVTHPYLSAQPSEVQRREVSDCKSALEETTGAPVASFSYPFGGPDAVASETVRFVRAAGYRRACLVGDHSPAGLADLELPRYVVGNWDGDEFERRLQIWLNQ